MMILPPQGDYERLLATFGHVRSLNSLLQRRWTLNRVASFHDLPRSEIRKLFELYLLEHDELLGQFSKEGGGL